MKARDLGVIACKALAIYALLLGLEAFRQFAQVLAQVMSWRPKGSVPGALAVLIGFLPLAVMAIVAGILW